MATLAFKILPNRQRSNGTFGIYLSVAHNGETRYISTDLVVASEQHFKDGKVCKCKGASDVNKRLLELLREYRSRLNKLNVFDYPNCSNLKDALMKKPRDVKRLTIYDVITDRIKKLEDEGRMNYARMYRDSLKVYTDILGNPLLSIVSRVHIRKLSDEMQRRGYSPGSRQIRLAHLKASINEAITERVVKYEDHPFAGFVMPSSGRRQTDLTIEQFQMLRDFQPTSTRARFARDMFLLSFYLGGINLVDLLQVDLSGVEIRYKRKKTKDKKNGDTETVFTIPDVIRPLIKKYAPNGRLIWPGKTERYEIIMAYINNCFRMLRKELGVNPLSYYSARHTFAQFAFEIGTPLEIVEYLLGQSMKTNRPVFNYVRVMKKQADVSLCQVVEYTLNPESFVL